VSEPSLPPPPPPLAAPDGYAGYTPSNWAAGLRRVGGLATALLILVAVTAAGQALAAATTPSAVDAAQEFLASDRTQADEDELSSDLAVNGLISLVSGAAWIASIVLSMIWLYRVAGNHRNLGRQLTWAPGWAIGGWFVPPLLFIIPLLMLRETWKASTPAVPPGSPEWKRESDSPLPWLWFVIYSIVPLVLLALSGSAQLQGFSQDSEDLAEAFDDQQGLLIAQGIVIVVAAFVWALLVRGITKRHTQLTGEATLR
jgi:hypothetical protein